MNGAVPCVPRMQSGTFETNLGTLTSSGTFDITGLSGLTVGNIAVIQQASGPYTGKGTLDDESQMEAVNVTGYVLNATTLRCHWNSPAIVTGNLKFNYLIHLK